MTAPDIAPESGTIARSEFGAQQTSALAETASSAVAAQAQAEVQARYIIAMQRPRDWDDVRTRLLKECRRSGFAEVAIYHKPVGKGIEGPSIRFAEAALRCMTNVMAPASTVYEDASKRIVRVTVTDLETNSTYTKDITIAKTVERSTVKKGQTVLGERINSHGRKVYVIEATDDELLNKEAALISKALRTSALRLLPGDILDECLRTLEATRKSDVESDPDAARKKIVDAFSAAGVEPSDLKAYLGHEVGQCTAGEILELRAVYQSLQQSEANWPDIMSAKHGAPGDSQSEPDPKAQQLRDKLAGKVDELRRKEQSPADAVPTPALAVDEDGYDPETDPDTDGCPEGGEA